MKKVLAIAPYSYLPFYSGGQKFIANFFEHLGREVDLTVISVADNDLTWAENYRILPLLKRSFSRYYDRGLIKKLSTLIQKEKYDTIIWEHPYFGWLAKKIKQRTGIKTIIHTHNIEYQRFRSVGKWWWPILRMYERKCLQRADTIFFITPEDRDFAITKWNIAAEKTLIVPYGVGLEQQPSDKEESIKVICEKHGIPKTEKIFLFNGLLNYKPNLDAVMAIRDQIDPRLQRSAINYKIIICGKGLPTDMTGSKNVIYAGFVDDIETYFKGADLFLNPVLSGGGIKTKMIEAIANGTTTISTKTGATGIDPSVCGKKLLITEDNNWDDFTQKIIAAAKNSSEPTPVDFYSEYGWKNIMSRVIHHIGT